MQASYLFNFALGRILHSEKGCSISIKILRHPGRPPKAALQIRYHHSKLSWTFQTINICYIAETTPPPCMASYRSTGGSRWCISISAIFKQLHQKKLFGFSAAWIKHLRQTRNFLHTPTLWVTLKVLLRRKRHRQLRAALYTLYTSLWRDHCEDAIRWQLFRQKRKHLST